MDDNEIVQQFLKRSEDAIKNTEIKYGKYCHYIAYHILYNEEDTEKCVNDTYVNAWNSIPPQKPKRLKYFLGAITRNLALNRLDYNRAKKRSAEATLVIDELNDFVPAGGTPIEDKLLLKETVNGFLSSLNKRTRMIFMQRYWYMCSVSEIAKNMKLSEANIKVTLYRTREKFKIYLEKEGIAL